MRFSFDRFERSHPLADSWRQLTKIHKRTIFLYIHWKEGSGHSHWAAYVRNCLIECTTAIYPRQNSWAVRAARVAYTFRRVQTVFDISNILTCFFFSSTAAVVVSHLKILHRIIDIISSPEKMSIAYSWIRVQCESELCEYINYLYKIVNWNLAPIVRKKINFYFRFELKCTNNRMCV